LKTGGQQVERRPYIAEPVCVVNGGCLLNTQGSGVEGIINGGVGHNLPQEAPREFHQAVVEVDGY
jgi:hypothetical protein